MTIRYDDQVAIVTGSGNGLGRSHAWHWLPVAPRSWLTISVVR